MGLNLVSYHCLIVSELPQPYNYKGRVTHFLSYNIVMNIYNSNDVMAHL